MDTNHEGPLNIGIKLSLRDSLNFTYNFDIAKCKHLIFCGFSLGLRPVHGGCLFALDTKRNCLEKEETKFIGGLVATPGSTKPSTSPLFFNVFNQLGVETPQTQRPTAEISALAAKRFDNKITAGVILGVNARHCKDVSFAGVASYDVDDETVASVYVNRRLSVGVGVTRLIDAYHAVSLLAVADAGYLGLRFGFNIEYRPEPPLLLKIKYKLKEFKREGGVVGRGGDSDLASMQEKLEEEARRTSEAVKNTLQEAKRSWDEFLCKK